MDRKIKECPLCASEAEYIEFDHHDKKHFYCKKCVQFVTEHSGEELAAKMPNEWKQQASDTASQAKPGQILFVKMVDISRLKPGEQKYPVLEICDPSKFQQ